eukprot:6200373-Pleurochrysis_carterae.AAC.1
MRQLQAMKESAWQYAGRVRLALVDHASARIFHVNQGSQGACAPQLHQTRQICGMFTPAHTSDAVEYYDSMLLAGNFT